MKRFLSLFIAVVAFSSCQEDVKFNNPGFQGLKDDVFWRANDARAYVDASGKLSIEALTTYETVTLNTSSANVGTYVLGTTNINNSATYSSNLNDIELEYATIAVPGPTGSISLTNGGTGYSSGTAVATTGGTGSGLTVNTTVNASGVVTAVTIATRGSGYLAGDLITVAGGNVNCRIRVTNVQNSNGEIKITEYDQVNFTITGKFKFNAANSNGNPFGNPILNFQYGEFYKIPIYPSI
ncbi:DUF6252 family protein [Flavobacterium sp. AS60]|uniref:DUF6252 family protein n=1 Tax=Flavobacterium anseongense TaxID=2910677 RepID=UPI001F1D7DDB|nr:DUF6252 family protein [Flavobacterium sp. AS60]MCF6129228.1 DUF6252 family protein [Flavobacterium sp. AS60]